MKHSLRFWNLVGILFLITGLISYNVNAQSTANYAFTTNNDGTLTADINGNTIDMTTGTASLLAASSDDISSALTNIGFDFTLMGTKYTQFSVTENGLMQFGSIATGSTYTIPSTTLPIITAFANDKRVGANGFVKSKITGTAPNRCLVVEWNNIMIGYLSTAAAGTGTWQVRIYETTGAIEMVYGSMAANSAAPTTYITGFSVNTTVNNLVTVNTTTNTASTSATVTTNSYSASSVITTLNSSVDGARRYYRFTPSIPAAPTALSFSSISPISMTLNWTDNSSNELGFYIYKSTDGGITYTYVNTSAANSTSSVQSGLFPDINYFWKIYAVSEGCFSSLLQGSQQTPSAGIMTTNGTGGGLWSAASTWSTGVVPTGSDNVTILNGDVVTIDVNALALNLTVGQGTSGSLIYESTTPRTLAVNMDINISANASFSSNSSGTVTTHMLSVGGNLTNNGILDFSTNSNTAGAVITFTGANNSSFTGTGATTDLYSLSLSKSARTVTLEINLSNLSVRGITSSSTAPLLTSGTGTGTLKISGTNTFDGTLWSTAPYSIPSTLGFWLNNPNFTVNSLAGSSTVSGLFRISAGTYNIGTATGNSMGFVSGSTIIVEGGAINSVGRFGVATAANAFSYTQTGGTITVCTIGNTSTTLGNFDLGTSTASTITISGGTIIIQLASTAASGPRDYRNSAGTGIIGVTGGTLQLGNALSGSAKAFTIGGVIPNLVITNTSANHSATLNTTLINYNNISQNITISSGTTINFSNIVFLFYGNTILNNGTITHTGASSRFITLIPNTNILYTGTGTVTAPMTSLELQNDLNFTIDPASPSIVVSRLIIFNGNFVNANKLILGNGAATSGTIQFGNTTTPTTGGTFDVVPTFNLGTGGQALSYLRTVLPKVIGPEVNPSRILTSMSIDPDAGNTVTLTGGDLQVATTLTLTTGSLDLGGNKLTLGTNVPAAGTLVSTGTLFNGQFKRWIPIATGNYDFPIGTVINSPDSKTVINKFRFLQEKSDLSNSAESLDNSVVGLIAGEVISSSAAIGNNSPAISENILSVTPLKRLASINFTTVPTVLGSLTAEWVNTPGGTNGLPLDEGTISIDQTSNDGYWRFTPGDGLTGGIFTGTFTGSSVSGVLDFTKLVLLNRGDNTSPWALNGLHITTTGSNSAPVISRTGLTAFGDFSIGGSIADNPLPVELSSFTSTIKGRDVILNWKTKTEIQLSRFVIERTESGKSDWIFAGEINANGSSNTERDYIFIDKKMSSGKYIYRLKTIDVDGTSNTYVNFAEATIGLPNEYILNQNYPNPFNPSTKIEYQLPYDSNVKLELYSISGQKVALIVNELQKAGYYSQSIDLSRLNLVSGVYIYRMTATGIGYKVNFVNVKKMVMLK